GVLRRHDALRTRLADSADGRPRLYVADEPVLRLTRADLTGLPAPAAAERVAREAAGSAATALDLESGRTSAFRLLRTAADEHVLILASHLAVFDGWSSGVFLADLAAGYRGSPADPAPPALQFPDYADWQH
ncbi:non-ribosomal peptide synthetase, partial [Streptomyces sp. WAC04770]